jgi:hypothetical protein
VPRPLLDDAVVVDAVPARLVEGAVDDLEHADRTRCGPVDAERITRPRETPVGSRDGITRGLDLREGGEEIRRDDGSRMARRVAVGAQVSSCVLWSESSIGK